MLLLLAWAAWTAGWVAWGLHAKRPVDLLTAFVACMVGAVALML